jgi:hypothetical protein
MAKQNLPNRNTIATITDDRGRIILEVRQDEYLLVGDDGTLTSNANYRNIQLVDGMTWNPSMLSANPPIHIGVCAVCRERRLLIGPRSHGLVSMARARQCECGRLVCPRHRRLFRSENVWLCPHCALKHRVKSLLRPLFFARVED